MLIGRCVLLRRLRGRYTEKLAKKHGQKQEIAIIDRERDSNMASKSNSSATPVPEDEPPPSELATIGIALCTTFVAV